MNSCKKSKKNYIYNIFTGNSIKKDNESNYRYVARVLISVLAAFANIAFLISIFKFIYDFESAQSIQEFAFNAIFIGAAITILTIMMINNSGEDSPFFLTIMPACLVVAVTISLYSAYIMVLEIYQNGKPFISASPIGSYFTMNAGRRIFFYITNNPTELAAALFFFWVSRQTFIFFNFTREQDRIWANFPIIACLIFVIYHYYSVDYENIVKFSLRDLLNRPFNYIIMLFIIGRLMQIILLLLGVKMARNTEKNTSRDDLE